jgi:glycogen(starch) synthase
MKLLVINNLYPPHYVGGYELHCEQVTEGLRARGHEVQVLTSDYATSRPDVPQPHVQRALRIHGMFGNPWLPIHKLEKLERHNNQQLRVLLKSFKPDLVYGWNFSGLSKSMLLTIQKTGVPTVFAVCDHWIARSGESDVWLRWWNRKPQSTANRMLRAFWTATGHRKRIQAVAPTNPVEELRFPRLYFCSSSLRDFTVAAGFNVKHGAVIYCPINTSRFQSTPKPAEAPVRRLLYVGRLHEDKGVMTALRAMYVVKGKFDGMLSVYGSGDPDYERKLHDFVRHQNLPVQFYSALPPSEMPAVYAAHDALLFTSEWPEPFALTPLEAMASGLPVIGTTTGGSIELFRDHKNCLTYKAGDFEDLADRILELAGDRSMRVKIATLGQQEVRSRYAEPVIVDQVEQYLKETLQKAHA